MNNLYKQYLLTYLNHQSTFHKQLVILNEGVSTNYENKSQVIF